ncbi:uncharacterized protein LOC108913463 [Anoplophora glabripennis]|uniref:uncharacterized protein LOC108913463 n=1 Tax=Anoplophora glabripennis TaxID=217634 RepID=UPI0008750553|nr:uncharacterized protein LOC108913463 [Anoplophora glabripennis]
MSKFFIIRDAVKKVRRFNLVGRTLEFKIKPVPVGEEPVGWVKEAIQQAIAKGAEGLNPEDQVSFSFCSRDFVRGDGWVRFKPAGEVTYDDVWGVISSVYQSNSAGLNTETFCLGVTSVKMPAGKGNDRGRLYNTFDEECALRKGIMKIDNKDNLCLPRALVVAIAQVTKDAEYRKVRRDIGKIQTQRAQDLIRVPGVTIPEEGCGILELQEFQRYLTNYRIVVYQYGSKGRDAIFKGCTEGTSLNLIYHEGHYNVITSLTAAFRCIYYCERCQVPYNNKNDHRCGGTCPACQKSPACQEDIAVNCTDCQRSCRGQQCYDNHLTNICAQIRRCPDCLKVVKRGRTHICGEIYCKICNAHVFADHLCYMQPNTGKPKTDDLLFVFYDLETQQEKARSDGSLLHEPNLCVFKQCCDACLNTPQQKICSKCGVRLQILQCNDPISPFLRHLMTMREKFKQVVVVAHNGQAFDHQFCLNYILTKTDLTPELIMRGTKIISMVVGNVKFLDSLNYFPMALSRLPKAFGLGNNLKKGYFPHLFNTAENQNYVGPLPVAEYYDPDNMKPEDHSKFLEWHEEHKDDEFNMRRDLVEYCISDVEILTAACLKFREQLMETGNVCPYTEACTIASACNKVYRRNFLKPNTIGIIPKGGYRWRDNQSKIAIQWLVWEEHTRGKNIQHAAKQQESRVAGVKVDGYAAETNQVFEFNGCYFHGCPTCFKCNRDAPMPEDPSQTLNTRHEATLAKMQRLRDLGYEVVEMWECGFRRDLHKNDEVRTYTENHPLVTLTPLNPRDAFYGGRTWNTVEYYKCGPGEKIKYVDVCSLYPWVCKYGKFPVGHPKIYVGEECPTDLHNVNGVVKCKILPPQNFYHPVLPTKMNNKLMFVLCRTCGEHMNTSECRHNDVERALTGTWVTDEIVKAVEKGYRLLEIHEIWAYDVQQYDKAARIGGLFTGMMNKFISVKQQASGWPVHYTTDEEKERYIEQFLQRDTFWGKLGQRENQPKTSVVRNPSEFFGMLTNPSIYVNSALPINEDTLVVNWEHKEEAYDPLITVNGVIAAYVTTQARLKLYSYLEQLGDRVLYYDTDSVIYVAKDGEYDVPTGEFLGDMTDELEGDNEEKVVCKVKGISLNYTASQLINFNTIKDMVLDTSTTSPVCVASRNILRTKEHEVITVQQTKLYKPLSVKRWFLDDHSSVPYGFKRPKL